MDFNTYKYVGIIKDKVESKEKTYNGEIYFDLDYLKVDESSRLSGKLKNSFKVNYSDISLDSIDRVSLYKLSINVPGHLLTLRVYDEKMLDEFENILKYKLTGELNESILGNGSESKLEPKVIISNTPNEIREYYQLFKDGIITEEEFEAKKKQLLDL